MRLSKIKPWISVIVVLILVGLGALYIFRHLEDFAILRRVGVVSLFPVLAFAVLALFVGGFQLNLFLRGYGVALPWYRWFGIYMMMTIGNTVTPVRGGTGMCAVYLKSVHGLNYGRFAMVLLGTYVLSALVNSALSLVGIGAAYVTQGWFSMSLVIVSVVILLGCVATFFIPNLGESDRWGWKYVVRMINGWHELVHDRSLLWRVALVTFALNMAQAGCYVFVYRALGIRVHPFAVVTIVSLGTIGALVSLTPASLGFYDAAIIAVPTVFGLTVAEAASALVVFRAVWLVATFGLGAIFCLAVRVPTEEGCDQPKAGNQ